MRGRGGARGRGSGVDAGFRGGKRTRALRKGPVENADAMEEVLSGEEKRYQEYRDAVEAGLRVQYSADTTNADALVGHGPVVATSGTRGTGETVLGMLQMIARQKGVEYVTPDEQLNRYAHGKPIWFHNLEDKEQTLDIGFARAYDADRVEQFEKTLKDGVEFHGLAEDEKEEILATLASGKYPGLKHASKGAVLASVEALCRHNETYRPINGERFMAKVEGLLPALKAQRSTTQQAAKQ